MRARHAPRAGRPELGQVPELLHLLAHDVAEPVDVDAAVAEPAGLHVALCVHRRKHDLEPRPGGGVGAVPLAVMPAELAPEIEEDVVDAIAAQHDRIDDVVVEEEALVRVVHREEEVAKWDAVRAACAAHALRLFRAPRGFSKSAYIS